VIIDGPAELTERTGAAYTATTRDDRDRRAIE
jgi:hypothetical protein